MITPISTFAKTINLRNDKNTTFTGRLLRSGYYSDEVITDARRFMHETNAQWKATLKKEKISRLQDSEGKFTPMSLLGQVMSVIYRGPFALFNRPGTMEELAEAHVRKVSRLIPMLSREQT